MPTVTTNGIKTYDEAQGDGHPVVFIHGATSDHQLWHPQLDGLADEYRTLAYDMRDHGQTDPSDVDSYTIDQLVEDLQAFLDALALDTPSSAASPWVASSPNNTPSTTPTKPPATSSPTPTPQQRTRRQNTSSAT